MGDKFILININILVWASQINLSYLLAQNSNHK